jgi:hypothetical protein
MSDDDIGTVRWFGQSWGAPVNDPRAHMSVPLGEWCIHCKVHFDHGDQGFGIAAHTSIAANGQVFYHRNCLFDEIGVPHA